MGQLEADTEGFTQLSSRVNILYYYTRQYTNTARGL
jgi:hypothetical protein